MKKNSDAYDYNDMIERYGLVISMGQYSFHATYDSVGYHSYRLGIDENIELFPPAGSQLSNQKWELSIDPRNGLDIQSDDLDDNFKEQAIAMLDQYLNKNTRKGKTMKAKRMKKSYSIMDTVANDYADRNIENLEEAQSIVREFEESDKKTDTFVENSYKIIDDSTGEEVPIVRSTRKAKAMRKNTMKGMKNGMKKSDECDSLGIFFGNIMDLASAGIDYCDSDDIDNAREHKRLIERECELSNGQFSQRKSARKSISKSLNLSNIQNAIESNINDAWNGRFQEVINYSPDNLEKIIEYVVIGVVEGSSTDILYGAINRVGAESGALKSTRKSKLIKKSDDEQYVYNKIAEIYNLCDDLITRLPRGSDSSRMCIEGLIQSADELKVYFEQYMMNKSRKKSLIKQLDDIVDDEKHGCDCKAKRKWFAKEEEPESEDDELKSRKGYIRRARKGMRKGHDMYDGMKVIVDGQTFTLHWNDLGNGPRDTYSVEDENGRWLACEVNERMSRDEVAEEIRYAVDNGFVESRRKSVRKADSDATESEFDEVTDGKKIDSGNDTADEEKNCLDDVDDGEEMGSGNDIADEEKNDLDTDVDAPKSRRKNVRKFSVTMDGGQRYDGREKVDLNPMMRECVDRDTNKDMVKSMNDRIAELSKQSRDSTKNPLGQRKIRY